MIVVVDFGLADCKPGIVAIGSAIAVAVVVAGQLLLATGNGDAAGSRPSSLAVAAAVGSLLPQHASPDGDASGDVDDDLD